MRLNKSGFLNLIIFSKWSILSLWRLIIIFSKRIMSLFNRVTYLFWKLLCPYFILTILGNDTIRRSIGGETFSDRMFIWLICRMAFTSTITSGSISNLRLHNSGYILILGNFFINDFLLWRCLFMNNDFFNYFLRFFFIDLSFQ